MGLIFPLSHSSTYLCSHRHCKAFEKWGKSLLPGGFEGRSCRSAPCRPPKSSHLALLQGQLLAAALLFVVLGHETIWASHRARADVPGGRLAGETNAFVLLFN